MAADGAPAARVDRTGIALVHEGEYVYPAPGSEALISPVSVTTDAGRLSLHFPVEVVVVGELGPAQMDALADHVFAALDTAFRTQIRGSA
jgi:hypothetical protein